MSDAAERHAEAEVKSTLKGLLRNLETVKAQRDATAREIQPSAVHRARLDGEIWGLKVAIDAIKRRIR